MDFLSRARDKNKNDQKNLRRKLVIIAETGRSQATNLKKQKQTKWIEMHQSQVKMCSLRGLLRWLTEQKNPKFLWTLQNAQRDTTNLAINRDFFGYSKLMFLLFVLYHFMLLGNFYYGSEIRHGFFWGINFGPVIFLGFVWSPRDFFGFGFLPPFDHPFYLKSGVPPLGLS